jgi:hypothetical protein
MVTKIKDSLLFFLGMVALVFLSLVIILLVGVMIQKANNQVCINAYGRGFVFLDKDKANNKTICGNGTGTLFFIE